MNRLRHLSVLFLAALFALTMAPVAAQEEATSALDDVTQLEGIEAAVGRSYSIDFEALMAITPEAGADDPFATMEGIVFLFMTALEFDSDDNAEAAFDLVKEEGASSFEGDFEGEDVEFIEGEIEGLGDNAWGIDVVSTSGDTEGVYRIAYAQEDEYLFAVITVATTEDGVTNNDVLLEYLVDEGDKGDDVEFNADGGSTGGLWDFFPDDDNDALEGVIPSGDETLFPVEEDEAE